MGKRAATDSKIRDRRSHDVLGATERILWPLVKLLLHRGITFPVVVEALKTIYLQVAMREFPPEKARETDSRLSLLTGVYRREVHKLRAELASGSPGRARRPRRTARTGGHSATGSSLAPLVLAAWTGQRKYRDAAGNPRPLARLARHDPWRSFEALVSSINKDVRPRALLDEWLRRGAVTLDDEDRVCLNREAFVAMRELDELAHDFAQGLHDHFAAVAHNLTEGDPAMLEIWTGHGPLSSESVARLAATARNAGMEALHGVSREGREMQKRDARKADAQQRVSFGLYFYASGPRDHAARGPKQ